MHAAIPPASPEGGERGMETSAASGAAGGGADDDEDDDEAGVALHLSVTYGTSPSTSNLMRCQLGVIR